MRFKIILADCPWKYNSRANHKTRFRGGAEGHYSLMTIPQIKALPISDLAEESSVLFMWATFPFIKEQIEVIEAWGFRLSTIGFLWTKLNPKGYIRPEEDPNYRWDWETGKPVKTYVLYPGDGLYHSVFFGVGYFSKSCTEPCLLATRGKVMKPISNAVSSAVLAPRREHSRKPDEVRERIVQLYGDIPKIELFARPAPDDDDSWYRLGNEMSGEDISVSMRRMINADRDIVMNIKKKPQLALPLVSSAYSASPHQSPQHSTPKTYSFCILLNPTFPNFFTHHFIS